MRRAFTLMELMVVVGIMAFLGLAATNGYNALQRGIAERSAVDAASSLLKAAKERAQVDRVPTAVFCYNRMLREAGDENAKIVGEAVAVRRAGRITRVQGKYLYDEFGDLDRSYDRLTPSEQSELQGRKGMRLWRFDDQNMNHMQYSVVADAVLDDDDVPGVSFMSWGNMAEDSSGAAQNGVPAELRQEFGSRQWKIRACAFCNLNKSDHEPPSWKVGNGYGFEFQKLRLPNDFVFGSSVPSVAGQIVEAGAFVFYPGTTSDRQVDIYFCRANTGGTPVPHHRAGTASSDRNAAR